MIHSAITILLLASLSSTADALIEISGSPFDITEAPISPRIKPPGEKLIVVDPNAHIYGAYSAKGVLVRWGIATAGSDRCRDTGERCHTSKGGFRIYSLGNANCYSRKYNDAPMPYCMYFNGGEALHGSNEVEFENISHGCVRVHIEDAKWLRYHFVEAPNINNHYQGTKIIIKAY